MSDSADLSLALVNMIMGAGESIYVRGSADLLRRSGLTDGHLLAVDNRLDLRCILCQTTFDPRDDLFINLDVVPIDEPFPDDYQAGSRHWQMRRGDGHADRLDIIIDDSEWLAFDVRTDGTVAGGAVSGKAPAAARRFRKEWEESDKIDLLFIQDNEVLSNTHEPLILLQQKAQWDAFLAAMLARPEKLELIGDRKFEEFVAEMLARDGFDVTLTPQSRDGGYDVLAKRRVSTLDLLFLVECKRYCRSRKVGVAIIRSLYGLVCEKRANAGIIVTTSTFSKPAIATSCALGTQLALRDYHGLVEWMQRLRT